jgi:hypothetical protein
VREQIPEILAVCVGRPENDAPTIKRQLGKRNASRDHSTTGDFDGLPNVVLPVDEEIYTSD